MFVRTGRGNFGGRRFAGRFNSADPRAERAALTSLVLALLLTATQITPAAAAPDLAGSAGPAGLTGFAEEDPAEEEDDGLRVEAESIYRVKPDEGVVEVTINYSLTNEVPNYTRGYTIYQTYFSNMSELIPLEAQQIEAHRSNGSTLSVTQTDVTDETQVSLSESNLGSWDVSFGRNLFFGQTRKITVSYVIPDGPARSEEAWARVNPAFIAVIPIPHGDPGLSTVRVELPVDFSVDVLGDDMVKTWSGGTQNLEAKNIEDPFEWGVAVLADNIEGHSQSSFDVPGVDGALSVSWWPGDNVWKDFIEDNAQAGLPILQEATGIPWPLGGELEISETVAPYIAGYAGWYYEPPGDTSDDAYVEVGEDLDLVVLMHELAHAWFNDDFTAMRWLSEGLSETLAQSTVEQVDSSQSDPFPATTRTDPHAVALIDWRIPGRDVDFDEESYGYSASYMVVSGIAEAIGDESMAAAITVMWDRANPYDITLDDPGPQRVDWMDALDAFEIIGGSSEAEDLFTKWVLDDDQSEQLAARADARIQYAALIDRNHAWQIPDLIPTLMAEWSFDDAMSLLAEMELILNSADDLAERAQTRSISVPIRPKEVYESTPAVAEAFDSVRHLIADQSEALDALLAALARNEEPSSFFDGIGLYGTDVDTDLALAVSLFEDSSYERSIEQADAVIVLLDDARSEGIRRVSIAAGAAFGLLVMLGLAIWLIRRRRARRVIAPA